MKTLAQLSNLQPQELSNQCPFKWLICKAVDNNDAFLIGGLKEHVYME